MHDMTTAIGRIDHFSQLDPAALKRLLDGSRITTYPQGATILDPGHSGGFYSFLIEGRWWMSRLVVGVATPREWVDDRPGNWHGGITLIDRVAPPTVRAETDCVVLHVPRDLLDDLAAGNAHLAHAMLRGLRGGATMLHRHATGEA
jgi:CRP-like cAMP-binding protein